MPHASDPPLHTEPPVPRIDAPEASQPGTAAANGSDAPDIAIVIPFFQRKAGLLTQCVQSILDQADAPAYRIIVVDDGSPIAADTELAELIPIAGDRLQIIRQPNAGPGAARNRGLDSVPPGTRYVTFLDSDDAWCGPFLSDAVHALDQGYDFFFGNSTRVGKPDTRFEWDRQPERNIRAEEHQLIDAERGIHEYGGDFFDLLVRRSSIVGPTTLAYRFERFPEVRFDPRLYNGQDRLFKLSLGQHLQRVAFSARPYAHEGEGINIFDKSQWGSPDSLRFLSSYIRLAKYILADIRLNDEQRRFVAAQLLDSRRSFVASIVHLLGKRAPIDWSRVFATFREDPATAATVVPELLCIVSGRLRRQ
ncbi:MAG: glycosyltransferase family 2 protein [Gammaproteobacteria bacterium]|jgi:succinoglycan biosynthesis protein ExoW|nr:glycosyltransferase family 2 protein [Gammaproteobacteria bacterium]